MAISNTDRHDHSNLLDRYSSQLQNLIMRSDLIKTTTKRDWRFR
jgi:hypothetical protein